MVIFRHPFSTIVAAPSNTGKSTLVFNIISKSDSIVLGGGFDCCVVIYKSWQPLYNEFRREFAPKDVHFFAKSAVDTIIGKESLIRRYLRPVVVCDDGLSTETEDFVVDIFCRLGHHWNISIFLICHTIFDSHALRICHRNAKSLIIFACPRDQTGLRTLIYQMYPERNKAKLVLAAVQKELEKAYNYVLFDFDPRCPTEERIKCNILCEREPEPFALRFVSR